MCNQKCNVGEMETSEKDLEKVEKRLIETNEKVKILAQNLQNLDIKCKEKSEVLVFECEKCDANFQSKKKLKDHFQKNHFGENKCNECGEAFKEHWEIEQHLKEHGKKKEFVCGKCEKTFYTKWRKEKHLEIHSTEMTKFCHYFNNCKVCPYEEFGCKFTHEESDECRFQGRCRNRLCQYRHCEGKQKTWKCRENNWMDGNCEFESRIELRLKNHMLAEHEIGEHFSCDDCDFVVVNRSEMIKNVETRHGKEYKLCGGNCADRMYRENSFICGKCEAFLCIICSRTEIGKKSS